MENKDIKMNPYKIEKLDEDCYRLTVDGEQIGGLLHLYDLDCINSAIWPFLQENLYEVAPTVFERGEECAS